MSKMHQKLIIWAVLGCGSLASVFLLSGNWWLIAAMGTAIGFVLPFMLNKLAPVKPARFVDSDQRVTNSQDSTLRWIGAFVMAAGAFLLWKMLGKGLAAAMFEGHPWLASNGVYVAALPLGLGMNMLFTAFGFMRLPARKI
jgi:uncharacterized protein YjeT (DUF2065 family)